MAHTLVIPKDLQTKLLAAQGDTSTHDKWVAIGVDTVEDMYKKIISELNESNTKLSISGYRIEDKNDIKLRINHSGKASMFAGYFENDNSNVDALFFYVDPDASNANDFLASKIPPVIIGVYKNFKSETKDNHITNMPIYVVGICTTSRVTNTSVKQQIICAETMGINYVDVFKNPIYDIMSSNTDQVTHINTLQQLSDLFNGSASDSFKIDTKNKRISIKCKNALGRTNDTAYIYRWFLKVIPAVYIASKEGYEIDTNSIKNFTNGDMPLIRDYISKLL